MMWELDQFIRAVLVDFASKLSNQSVYRISRLSDDDLLKLVEEKFSELPKDEKQGIIDAVLGPLIYSLFPRRIPIPKDE
ncbi:hypothetical protein A2U01_0050583, partial [Trifolium medium]|nr:hypothetical protein [Trifolium medium]